MISEFYLGIMLSLVDRKITEIEEDALVTKVCSQHLKNLQSLRGVILNELGINSNDDITIWLERIVSAIDNG